MAMQIVRIHRGVISRTRRETTRFEDSCFSVRNFPTDKIFYLITTQTNVIHKSFYIKTFKIAPTCFVPKIIFRELHCSLLKSHF